MQESITKALLFVIALSTSIIAVELIPQNRIYRTKLACIEYKDLENHEISTMDIDLVRDQNKFLRLNKLQTQILGKAINSDIKRVKNYCASL